MSLPLGFENGKYCDFNHEIDNSQLKQKEKLDHQTRCCFYDFRYPVAFYMEEFFRMHSQSYLHCEN